jgi:diguanylate cyclase (GGDEF)-like protein/PAS domain S-box-containing protein
VQQLTGNFFLPAGNAAQGLDITNIAPDMIRERALTYDVVAPEEHLHLVFDAISSGVVVWSAPDRIVEANKAAEHILDVNLAEMPQYLLARDCSFLRRPDGTPLPQEERLVPLVFRTGQAQQNVLEGYTCPNGCVRWLLVDAVPLCGEDGLVTWVVVTLLDVTKHIEATKGILVSEERFRVLTEQSNDLTQIIDASGTFRYISPSHRQILGYAPENLLGTNAFALFHPDDLPQMQAAFASCLEVSGSLLRAQCRLRRADSSWLTVDGVGHNCFDDPAVKGVVITARDITERVNMEEALHYQALHDGLTGLPNSTQFINTLEQAVLGAEREQRAMDVLVLDVDRFEDVNNTYGHQRGDLLLQQVGIRLRDIVPAPDEVSRLSGDEFAILLLTADAVRARIVASAIQHALEEPCLVDGYSVQVDASIGGTLYPTHTTDGLTLLRRADMAMYTAKQTHEGYVLFDAACEQYNPQRLGLIADLRRAIATGELTLYYQPQVDLPTGSVSSVEALVRWLHPTSGLLPPDQFIPLAEQTGLIRPLTFWVLEAAVRQCGEWLRTGRRLKVAVNLSAWNLRDDTLLETIAALLERYAVPACLLCVELTESALMTDAGRSLDVLERIFALGVHISIDDFGTGYSSLAYLKHLPVDELKIDRSFVQHMATDGADAIIVRSTVDLAHSFGLRVVAEGVEDEATLHLLTALHCDLAQGYYLSRPIPAQELERWLRGTREETFARS